MSGAQSTCTGTIVGINPYHHPGRGPWAVVRVDGPQGPVDVQIRPEAWPEGGRGVAIGCQITARGQVTDVGGGRRHLMATSVTTADGCTHGAGCTP